MSCQPTRRGCCRHHSLLQIHGPRSDSGDFWAAQIQTAKSWGMTVPYVSQYAAGCQNVSERGWICWRGTRSTTRLPLGRQVAEEVEAMDDLTAGAVGWSTALVTICDVEKYWHLAQVQHDGSLQARYAGLDPLCQGSEHDHPASKMGLGRRHRTETVFQSELEGKADPSIGNYLFLINMICLVVRMDLGISELRVKKCTESKRVPLWVAPFCRRGGYQGFPTTPPERQNDMISRSSLEQCR